jgi:hypothetical protein
MTDLHPTTATTADATAFTTRARAAGHPVLHAAPGRWTSTETFPTWTPERPDGKLPPNDLLDLARDVAHARVGWVHAVLPTYTAAVRLAAAVQPAGTLVPRQMSGPATASAASPWRELLRRPSRGQHGDPRRVPFSVLVDQTPLSVVTLTVQQGGRTVHVVEIPAGWLGRPLVEVTL